jgi:NitT/TauT family transport system permease protein
MKKTLLPPLIPLIVISLLAEFLVREGFVRAFLVPAPSSVLRALIDNRLELVQGLLATSAGALAGFLMSAITGVAIAVLLSSSPGVQKAFYPYAIFFQTVPLIAVAPLLVIWFGFGIRTVIASAFVASVFPVIANTLSGILSTDPNLRDLFKLYGASPLVTLFKLRLPAALPQVFTGLRVSAGLAVIGAIVGEFIAGGGLGSVVEAARTQQRIDKVFAAVLLASLLGLGLFGLINLFSYLALRRWHASEQAQ